MKKTKITSAILMALLGFSVHAETKITAPVTGKGTPKYVFVFVGDGMSYPQIQSAAYYSGKDAGGIVDVVKKSENPSDSPEMKALSFYQFPVAGSASTYDATSFAPDSASTATSIFTGYKTHSSLDAFSEKFSSRILEKYLIYTKDLGKDKDVLGIPFYISVFL